MCDIRGIGTDICSVARFEEALRKPHFMERMYTQDERAYIGSKGAGAAQSAAAMFAAKEAAAKALGTGFAAGIMPAQIEVTHDAQGAPGIALHGAAKERFLALGAQKMMVSLSHDGGMALAYVVMS